MKIEKRTMNWLPRASLHDEAEAARLKRRAHARDAISQSAAVNTNLIGLNNTFSTGESINLTLRVAAQRIQDQANARLQKTQDSLGKIA